MIANESLMLTTQALAEDEDLQESNKHNRKALVGLLFGLNLHMPKAT